ncbi:MAG: phosphate uptake regulator PhoU [Bacteroidia bacterium]|nr:phosphate uptake regulator PhoU [Bacteroidia bacterium]MDW8417056.1 phosphate uptake regulator PhoU [Bacteroidia bacterium]
MSLIETEIAKLRARAYQVVNQVRLQWSLLEEGVRMKDWPRLLEIERLREDALEEDMRLDRRCARILALHQPVASDLRFVLATLRMHFYLDEIGERLPAVGRRLAQSMPNLSASQDIPIERLVSSVRRLLESCLEAFFQSDTDKAKSIDREDELVDRTYEECMRYIVRALSLPLSEKEATAWLEIAIATKTLEKIADYAIDIADASIYYAEGVYYWHRFVRRSSSEP